MQSFHLGAALCRGLFLVSWVCFVTAAHGQARGFAVVGNQLRVESPQHWSEWDVSVGAASISPDGSVTPQFLRRQVNASLDASSFGDPPGGAAAGSNPETASYIHDGDLSTFWGPDLDDLAEDWWIQLRLGRTVVVDSVVLRFVGPDVGEPFLQFDVLGWRRPPPLSPSANVLTGTDVSRLWVLYRTDRPLRDERRIAFVPRTTESASEGFVGDPLDVLHILITDSDNERLREVAPTTWSAMPEEARGAIDHYRRSSSGRLTRTSAAAYEALIPERQGPVRHFLRERPRLAEIEVWTAGDNINHGLVTRGAVTTLTTRYDEFDLSTSITDGDYSTGPSRVVFKGEKNELYEDLGTLFWIDRMHFLTDYISGSIYTFDVDVSDGSLAPDGSLLWRSIGEQRVSARYRQFHMAPSRVRYVRARFGARSGSVQASVMETMLYGEGYVAQAELTSDVLDLGERKGLTTIEWRADTPEGTWMELSTRTGNSLSERFIYHDSDGNVVSETRYKTRLPRVKQGRILSTFEPGEDFSPWSPAYVRSGEEIRSPRTRRYLQVRARIAADTTSRDGPPAQLHSLRVNLVDLYVDELTSQLWPTRVQRIGEPEPRSLFLRAQHGSSQQGFDQVRITASAPTALDLVDLRVGSADAFRRQTPRLIVGARVERRSSLGDTLELIVPERLGTDVELIEVRLLSTQFGHSAAFEAAIKNSARQGDWQIAEVGLARPEARSASTVAVAVADNLVLSQLTVEPAVCTPNGDGINDVVHFRFQLSRLPLSPPRLAIHDLSGRRWRQLDEVRTDSRGSYEILWDGSDAQGRPVPAGTYVVQLQVEAQSGRAEAVHRLRAVTVAY